MAPNEMGKPGRRRFQEGNQEFCLGGLNWRWLVDSQAVPRRQTDTSLEAAGKAGQRRPCTRVCTQAQRSGGGTQPSQGHLLRLRAAKKALPPLPTPGQGGALKLSGFQPGLPPGVLLS